MAASAYASSISYTTNSPLTEFVAGINSLTLNSTAGQAGTITFEPNTSSTSGVPSNIDLGDFIMACPTCTTNQSTIFGAFTFDLLVDDTTDGATGEFVALRQAVRSPAPAAQFRSTGRPRYSWDRAQSIA